MNRPRISIITPSFNQGEFIGETVRSVLGQEYPDVEHIVMDGCSTDDTLEVLRQYPGVVAVSEPDRGQADALQKGFRLASGEIIGWINSDDYYAPAVFGAVAACFDDPAVLWVVGNLAYVYQGGEIVPNRSPPITYEALLRDPDIVKQPPAFFRRQALEAAGGWDPSFHMTMDLDLWVRLARLAPPRMIDAQWAYFRIHGKQKTSGHNVRRQANEIARILRREGVPRRRIIAHRLVREWYVAKARLKDGLIEARLLDSRYQNRPIRIR
jgi:glycosyltransferase involved in cell wall biosynthesis